MLSLKIRPATVNDIPSIAEIRSGALTEKEISGFSVPMDNPYSTIKSLRKIWNSQNLLNDGSEVFVAELEGKVVGFVVYSMKSVDDNIDNIVVAREEQGKGVGRALMENLIMIAKERKIKMMKGIVLAENRHMLALASKLGFSLYKIPGENLYDLKIDLGSADIE